MHADKVTAEIRIASDQSGATSASIRITTPDGRELDAKEVSLTLSNQERGIEPIKRAAMKSAHGEWQVQGVAIAVAGRWTLHLDVLASDFEVLSLDDVIDVGP
jgi:copper transport protein